jgi:CRISP-associated protein Cas1
VQIKAVADGYNPMLWIMHFERDRSPSFAFDLMEPERPKVNRTVLSFLKSEALHPSHFANTVDGEVRLNLKLARRVAGLPIHQLMTSSAGAVGAD